MRLKHFLQGLAVVVVILLWADSLSFGQKTDRLPQQPVSIKTFIPDDQRITPMPLQERIKRGVVPQRGVVSIAPGKGQNDQMKTGNGKMHININGNPLADEIPFRHEHIQLPWPIGTEGPKMASALPEVQRLILEGKYVEGLDLASKTAVANGFPEGQGEHDWLNAFIMNIDIPKDGAIKNYLRTVDFESGEVKVLWEDNRGAWERNAFVSRPDDIVVQLLTAPANKLLNTRIEITTGRGQMPALRGQAVRSATPGVQNGAANGIMSGANPPKNSPTQTFERDFNGERLIITDRFSGPNFGNKGYAAVIRIVLDGGSATIEDGVLVIKDAKSAMLLTRIEWYNDFQKSKVEELVHSLNQIKPDYQALLSRNRKVVSEVIDRTSLTFNTSKEEQAMSGEELLADQKTRIGYNLNLLEKLFDMGRYYLLNESGDYPPIKGHLNVNINLQVSGAPMADLPETMNSFSKWIDFMLPDAKTNANNIFGTRGALYATHPDRESGAMFHWDYGWPHHYWISAGGWVYSPIWDRYLVTGDKDYLRDRVMPGLRELGLFYEDFLKLKDKDGNYIFVPSYSPENWPANTSDLSLPNNRSNPPAMINATMDISVCREVLTHLIEGAETLGTDADKIQVWKALLDKMPPYMMDTEGALKEWSWSTLEEFQDHRHISHMYGVWPADEIDPDRTPELARAAWIANVKRAQGNGSGHGISHRMLAAARLKDNNLVNVELKQFLEQGYIGPVLSSSHNPYTGFFADQQGSILAVIMEMLVYSREGVVELLPALPETLDRGSIKGILARTFARIDNMAWDMKAKTADMTITSERDQDLTLIVRHGIESITAPSGVLASQPQTGATTCVLHLVKGKPVMVHVKLGNHKPSDWILNVASRK